MLISEGYLKLQQLRLLRKKKMRTRNILRGYLKDIAELKGGILVFDRLDIKEGETSPPKRDILRVHLYLPWKMQDS